MRVKRFALQARPLGNRLLFITEDKHLVPSWVERADREAAERRAPAP